MKIVKKSACMIACCAIISMITCTVAVAEQSTSLYSTVLGPGNMELGINQRFRYEYLDEYNIKKFGTGHDDNVLLSRTQLYLKYEIPHGPSFFLQGQDSRFWFSDDINKDDYIQQCPYYNDFDLRQAYIEWRKIANTALGFKAGRQTIGYGDGRIFAGGSWGNVGRHLWDAVIMSYAIEKVKFNFIYGQKILFDWNEFDGDHYDYDVYSLYVQTKPVSGHVLDLFYVLKNNDDSANGKDELTVHTVGFYGKGKWRQLDYNATAAYQFGEDGPDDIAAYMMHAQMGYTLPHRFQPRLSAGYTIGSGDDDPNDGDKKTYDGVFGGIASYYGRMNLFSGSNLEDLQAEISIKPCKGVSVSLDYHWFSLAEKKDAWYYCNNKAMRKDNTGSSGSDLGQELDLICKYKVNPHLELMAGYAFFVPGSFAENTGSSEDAHWGFTQVTISF
ncbi:alginate export family protein [Desulfobacula toluolica]|nr:alginate export family protein [Desulfobacula toluolica]